MLLPDTSLIRRALEQLPAACRYHGTRLDSDSPRREACCDTGLPSRLRRDALAALDRFGRDCAHSYPILSARGEPERFGPCDSCGQPYRDIVLHCYHCAGLIPRGGKCPRAACQAKEAEMLAKWRAEYPELFPVVNTVFCPVCKNYAESLEGEPELGPVVLNAVRCTEACAEQHTYRGGCQLAIETREGGSGA